MQILTLSDEEALLFLKFREYQTVFEVLDKAGVFKIANGKAILNFDANGTLCDIDCTIKTFKRLHS